MYVCMCVCISVRTYVCMHALMDRRMVVSLFVSLFVSFFVFLCFCKVMFRFVLRCSVMLCNACIEFDVLCCSVM